jgi:hypothetical protein
MKRRHRTTRPAAWVTGIGVAVGAAALLATMMPSARRYLRIRAM